MINITFSQYKTWGFNQFILPLICTIKAFKQTVCALKKTRPNAGDIF
jgi:hypothetical protein